MDSVRIYSELISRARAEGRIKGSDLYLELHHVRPRCVGGDDSDGNRVLLTAREHFLAHWLLVRISPKSFKLACAWNAFCQNPHGRRTTSHLYEYAKLHRNRLLRENADGWKQKVSATVSSQIWIKMGSVSFRVRPEELQRKLDEGWTRGRVIQHRMSPTQETRLKMSRAQKGRKLSPARRLVCARAAQGTSWMTD